MGLSLNEKKIKNPENSNPATNNLASGNSAAGIAGSAAAGILRFDKTAGPNSILDNSKLLFKKDETACTAAAEALRVLVPEVLPLLRKLLKLYNGFFECSSLEREIRIREIRQISSQAGSLWIGEDGECVYPKGSSSAAAAQALRHHFITATAPTLYAETLLAHPQNEGELRGPFYSSMQSPNHFLSDLLSITERPELAQELLASDNRYSPATKNKAPSVPAAHFIFPFSKVADLHAGSKIHPMPEENGFPLKDEAYLSDAQKSLISFYERNSDTLHAVIIACSRFIDTASAEQIHPGLLQIRTSELEDRTFDLRGALDFEGRLLPRSSLGAYDAILGLMHVLNASLPSTGRSARSFLSTSADERSEVIQSMQNQLSLLLDAYDLLGQLVFERNLPHPDITGLFLASEIQPDSFRPQPQQGE